MLAALVLLAGLAASVSAQNSTYKYSISPGSVSIGIRTDWCNQEQSACLSICDNQVTQTGFGCDANTLNYQCVCSGYKTPDLTQFNNTIPWNECMEYKSQCVQNTTVAQKQHQCLAIQCGGRDPTKYSTGGSSTSGSSTPTSSSSPASGGGSGDKAPTTTINSVPKQTGNSAITLQASESLSLTALVIAGLAVFGLGL